jgi:E3 ubiquitin-protein ligase HUWE1
VQSPWLKAYVKYAVSTPLPLLPKHLAKFPSRWPFPRGDLYHWIPLLNRFDDILECVCSTYKLSEGPQMRDFGCDLLLGKCSGLEEDTKELDAPQPLDADHLEKLGYSEDGDRQLIEVILKFSRMLLQHCGNRSIYASSPHLNDLLHTTSLDVVIATLEVGLELAHRYQASVKRIGSTSRPQFTGPLLANHYNIDLDRVQQLAGAFAKTPMINLSDSVSLHTPSSSKGKERPQSLIQKNAATMFANDLVAVASSEQSRWQGWGDIKVIYYPESSTGSATVTSPDQSHSTQPNTPTPLRRSTTSTHNTPSTGRQMLFDDSSPAAARSSGASRDERPTLGQSTFDLPQALVVSAPIQELLSRCPVDMPKASKYEVFNRLVVAKALMGSLETRQKILAVRLLAVTNLAYIHQDTIFVEKVLRQDIDETRRYKLVYQLAELIYPSSDNGQTVPIWLQAIALQLLDALSNIQTRYQDVISALNANVNHGILLYVIRKAVDGMKIDDASDDGMQETEDDVWRKQLFDLTQHLTMPTRIGSEMVSAGLMEILIEILNMSSKTAQRNHHTVLQFLDTLIWSYQNAYQSFFSANGLDALAQLIVSSVDVAARSIDAGQGTKPESHAHLVDYEIPFYQQQTLKWLLKFLHHIMSNAYSYGGNTDRLLRNLVDKSDLLLSLRNIMVNMRKFGSIVWTNAVTIMSDFINNDPTSFAAILESGMIKGYLEAVTGRAVADEQPTEAPPTGDNEDVETPNSSEESVVFEPDSRPHPPTEASLETPRTGALARGILPSSEAISVVPVVLNSVSLNNQGMRMVVASRAFESFLEIFESPAHVNCMKLDPELAAAIGSSFDELARHHPSLRQPISNAVIDMVARVVHIGKTKSQSAGWGAKLLITGADGNAITADENLGSRSNETTSSTKGKDKANSDFDVDMPDAEEESPAAEPLAPDGTSHTPRGEPTPYNDITPYIYAVANFFTAYVGNTNLKTMFIQKGGIDLLLDMCESPSLPYDFSESPASRTLQHVISQLIESSPILGLPSLLKRTQAALDFLSPIATRKDYHSPYFAPFLTDDLSLTAESMESGSPSRIEKVQSGTTIVKALVNTQTFLKTLAQCFPTSPRSNTVQLYPINVFDYYSSLVRSLGPLMRGILAEESAQDNFVPQHWSPRRSTSAADRLSGVPPDSTNNGISDGDGDGTGHDAVQPSAEELVHPSSGRRISKQEQSSARYQNYETLHTLLHAMMPTSFPFFQTLGKALLPRRERDSYSRPHHLEIAKTLAESVLSQLQPSVSQADPSSKDFHFWIIMLHTIHEMLIDRK